MPQAPDFRTLVTGLDSPEGPAFDAQGRLWFVNWLSSAVLRVGADGVAREMVNTGGIPAGLAFHRDGTLYVADEGAQHHGVLRLAGTPSGVPDGAGALTPWVQTFEGQPLNGANDLVFDAQGVLYFSDPWGSSLEKPIGGFYRAFPDGRLERLDGGLAFPNGVAIDPAGTAVYLAETGPNRVLRYALDRDGRVGERTVFATLEGGPGPDGMAFDVSENLYVAHHGEGRVDVLDPNGRLLEPLIVPGRQPTNVAFGGPDRRTLVVTEVATGSLYQTTVEVPGAPLFA
jgi:gluconolactonase